MKNWLLHIFLLFTPFLLKAQTIVEGEYFLNTDPGIGNGTAFTFTPKDSISEVISIPTSNFNTGFHTLYFRIKDELNRWSHYESSSFYVLENTSAIPSSFSIVSGEYFLDNDPGVGNGTPFSLTPNDTISETIFIPTSNLPSGFHTLYIRLKDELNRWSQYESTSFYVLKAENNAANNPLIVSGEYFIDTDPGVGNATTFSVNASDSISEIIAIPTTNFTAGFHSLHIRLKDELNRWSHYEKSTFYILKEPANANSTTFLRGEYFIDTDPGVGNGIAFVVPAQQDLTNFPISIDISAYADEEHTLHIRLMDSEGKWSHYESRDFYICGDLIDQPSLVLSNTTFCQGTQLSVTGIPVNDISSAFWTGPNDFFLESVVLVRNNALPSMSGTYTFHVVSEGGYHCDTNTVSINLTVHPSHSTYQQVDICYGDTLFVGNTAITEAGFHTTFLTSQNGCDSIISTSLNILPKNIHTQVIQRCIDETYTINGNTYTSSGTYYDTLVSVKGCDSIVVTNLFIGEPIIDTYISFSDSTLTAAANDVLYQWINCDADFSPIPGATNKELHLTSSGNYAVQLTSTICPYISVTTDCFEANNLHTPSLLWTNFIKIYPNPNQGFFTLELQDYENVVVNVKDIQGRLILTKDKLLSAISTIDISAYAAGTYLLEVVKNGEGNVFKIVRE